MKYLSGVLTVIAVCLVLITFAVTGVIPSAHAKETDPRAVMVPVNPDGSITVKMAQGEKVDVNVSFDERLDVNLERVSSYNPLPVKVVK